MCDPRRWVNSTVVDIPGWAVDGTETSHDDFS